MSEDPNLTIQLPSEYKEIFDKLSEPERVFLLDHYKSQPEELRTLLKRLSNAATESISVDAQRTAKEIHTKISTAATKEQLKLFTPFPTQMTRTSAFFPMSKNEMSERAYIKEMVIASHSWGEVVYSGPKLSVFDEDMLMFLLAAINGANEKFVDQIDGVRTYTYRGSLHKILLFKGVEKPSKRDYVEALNSFKLMANARFDLTTHTVGPGGKKTPKKTVFKNLIVGGEIDHETKEFCCTVNPFFYETYAAGQVTWLDVVMRARLKSPIAKALFRFVQSHREDRWQGPLMTLSASLNLDLSLPANKLRARIREAIKDLVEYDILLSNSHLQANTVTLFRNPKPHPKKKIATKKPTK